MDNCLTCRFSILASIEEGPGEGQPVYRCHRYPPVIIFDSHDAKLRQLLPIVSEGLWCGEWKSSAP